MSSHPKHYLTPEEYLEIERKAEYKSEYYAGQMFAMSGARAPHNRISANLIIHIGMQLRPTPCDVYTGDQRVLIPASGLYAYPDLTVVCGEPRFQDDETDTLLNPVLIVEVLSPSTESYDRSTKFEFYRTIESLKGYFMVASETMRAELFAPQTDSRWMLIAEGHNPEDIIELESIGCRLKLSDVYEKVEFRERKPPIRHVR